ncbi:MAG TPA: restriction endonuclease subunit S [Nitrospira sp.]|nr:restriction endonuclease subunit S [Nitrospira sp.]
MTGWPEVALGALCEVFSGYPFKSAHFTDDPDDVALVKGENVGQGEILWEISKRWPREDADDLARYRLQRDDIVLAMDRPWVPAGLKFARIGESDPEALVVQRVARLRATGDLDQRFLYYVIASSDFVAYVKNAARGVGVPHVSGKQIAEFRFGLPPRVAQEAIADILSAYDDLIENNRRRMVLLEEAARQLYREWFIRFRFPGHEHTHITNGVPEGWARGCLSDFYNTASGGTPSRTNPDFFTGDILWVKTQELLNGFVSDTEEKITEDALKKSAAVLFPERTVLVAMYGATIGQLGITACPASSNQACCAITPRDKRASFVHAFLFFRENKEKLVGLSMGAAQKNINQQVIRSFPMLMPPRHLMELFNEVLMPAFDLWLNLQLQNQKLRAARDLLLPRLMNGEIAI